MKILNLWTAPFSVRDAHSVRSYLVANGKSRHITSSVICCQPATIYLRSECYRSFFPAHAFYKILETNMPASETHCLPTSHSPELLVRILGIYPVLQSIVSSSHRSSICNLAATSHPIHSIISSAIGRLGNPFLSCTRELRRCILCNIPVCKDCGVEIRTQERAADTMRSLHYEQALIAGATQALRRGLCNSLQAVSNSRWHTLGYTPIYQRINRDFFCEVCIRRPRPRMGREVSEDRHPWVSHLAAVEIAMEMTRDLALRPAPPGLRRLLVPHLWAADIPHITSTCNCGRFGIGCAASPHLVPIQCVPTESELAGFVYFYEGGGLPVRHTCEMQFHVVPLYILDMPLDAGSGASGGPTPATITASVPQPPLPCSSGPPPH